jgi:hypothetical protein
MVTVSYPVLNVTTAATSAAITVIPQHSGPTGPQGPAGANGSNGSNGATGSQGPAGSAGSQGPAGAAGSNGARGPTGLQGPQGPAGKVELVTCKTVTRNPKTKRVCTTKLVTGPVKFTTAATDERASLSRHGVIYATGYARQTRAGMRTWLLAARRLARGRYTLTLTSRPGHRQIPTRTQSTIT